MLLFGMVRPLFLMPSFLSFPSFFFLARIFFSWSIVVVDGASARSLFGWGIGRNQRQPHHCHHSMPWWQSKKEANNNNSDFNAEEKIIIVDDDYDWDHRDSGIFIQSTKKPGPKEVYFVEWSHYNQTALEQYQKQLSRKQLYGSKILPWTKGRLRKELQALNADSFLLQNYFEPSALGKWMAQREENEKEPNRNNNPFFRDHDKNPTVAANLIEQSHTFHRTPRRITSLVPLMHLPADWPADQVAMTRATLCGDAVVSGPRWLIPSVQWFPSANQSQRRKKKKKAFQESNINNSTSSEKDDDASSSSFLRLEFYEIWITLDDTHKVGMFLQYNGMTGDLIQFFVMRQARLTTTAAAAAASPYTVATLDVMQAQLQAQKKWPILQSASTKSMPLSLDQDWKGCKGVCIHLESPTGRATRRETNTITSLYRSPTVSKQLRRRQQTNHDLFHMVEFTDGIYCIFPKSMHPRKLDKDVWFKLGCSTTKSSTTSSSILKRIVLCGHRSKHCLDTCVQEEWRKGSPAGDASGLEPQV